MTEPNPLAGSRSPFLRHGAEQPVKWLPWGDEAFDRAKREDRPVLLDIGAIWCHWCHVMDHESYEDEAIAQLINENFVPVKVDRDERPDVDARYQRSIQALSGEGGWPLTAFLTPEGEAFFGGTYFPPEDRFGRPGFQRVLREMARIWREEPDRATSAVGQVHERLTAFDKAESEEGQLSGAVLHKGIEAFADDFDFRFGGFGGAPKFPNAGAIDLLLDRWLDTGEEWMRRVVVETLGAMGRGGIYDQLGGGFHRYATDQRWRIPHFEKMAYDNGVLLESYSRAYAAVRDPLFRRVAEGIVHYYRDVSPSLVEAGGFPASQDADVGPDDDGSYWTWMPEEVKRALGGNDQAVRAATLRYGLDDTESAMPTDPARRVLHLAATEEKVAAELGLEPDAAAALLEDADRRLSAVRARRPQPYVDETVYTGWASLVASGHLAAARFAGVEHAAVPGLRALDTMWTEAFRAGRGVGHRLGDVESAELLEDQVYFARSLLDAFELTQDPEYLAKARQLVGIMDARFRDPERPGYLDRPRDGASPVAALDRPHRPLLDSPSPAANPVAALVLLRLDAISHSPEHRQCAIDLLNAFAGSLARMATSTATCLRAADWALSPVTTVAIVGERGEPTADALLRTALSTYRPRTVVRRFEPGSVLEEEISPALGAMLTGEAPRAYLCSARTCASPVRDVDALLQLLEEFRG